jgi:hypothetical protein
MNIFQAIIDWFKRLFGFGGKSSTPIIISPLAAPVGSAWTFQASPNSSISGNTFTFPSIDGVHYLVKGYSGGLTNGLELTYRIETTGTPVFDWHTGASSTGTGSGTVTLYFQRAGDGFSSEFGRWYGPRQELKDGTSTIVASLDPSDWGSVMGKRGDAAVSEFQKSIANVANVGMVFGGGDSAGHGVFVTGGTATFTIVDWKAS